MLVGILDGDEMAPLYVIRIWSNCQQRKSSVISGMSSHGLKALCRYAGDADLLERGLIEAGFIVREGNDICAPKWADHNAKLIANWQNGKRGGKPKKQHENEKHNPSAGLGYKNETQLEPNRNPNVTQSEPNSNPNSFFANPNDTLANPTLTDKIRLDIDKIKAVNNPNGLFVPSDADDELIKPEKPDKAECPHKEIIALYHEVLPMCPSIRDWTPARATQLRARWNEDPARHDLEWWRKLFEYIKTCDFLVGKSGKQPFFVDLPWITKAENFAKIREGRYENR